MVLIHEHPSPNHDERGKAGAPDMLVLHYTGMESGQAALERLCDPEARVSAHFLIEEDGRVMRLVPEHRRAWHAGLSHWAGEDNLNDAAIGIELVNPGHEFGYRSFPEVQMCSLIELAVVLQNRHGIPRHRVVGHSDVAPLRKEDPGELFDWPRLAACGLGLWSEECPSDVHMDESRARRALAGIGYGYLDEDFARVLLAFQRHFLRDHLTAELDPRTAGRLSAIAALYQEARGGREAGD
ncbi:N-acetylmuramoyl-L-alanine amidase [Fodinicurvata halophila]|uniref:N-acetylmuramoyl-L-alanine amidase n=1 Tax=Fodinicurvata halophila TaxID=1419723 RepID=A0ABV8UFI6_9PROT